MDINNLDHFPKAEIDSIDFLEGVKVDVLRLDQIHSVVSGNKWFKLKYHLYAVAQVNKQTLLSFGGVYSNHLHALAYAGKMFSLKTIGMVRGDEVSNPTLEDCAKWGMELHFISREQYKQKENEVFKQELSERFNEPFIIPEGGDGDFGIMGCKEILQEVDSSSYDLICVPIGRGTTFLGMLTSSSANFLGFSSLKNDRSVEQILTQLPSLQNWEINYDYDFGGFGQHTGELVDFMKMFKAKHNIELDMVYTAKMLYGIRDLHQNGKFDSVKNVLVIHTGGLQGNRSLKGFY